MSAHPSQSVQAYPRICLLFVLLWTLLCGATTASASDTRVFRYKGADGSIVFSDAPKSRNGLARTAYRGQYGRKPATASCVGLSSAALAERGRHYDALFNIASQRHGVPDALIRAVARTESCFDPKALSRAGAQGIMQLMPATAAELGVTDPYNPAQNIDGGVRYLSWLMKRYNNDRTLALAAYNAGPGNVDRYGGVPPFPETRKYVKRVQALLSR